ncbi:hypothetical protein K1567_27380 [Pseudomonas sp. S5F11]|nr:hypothetical protein [Pseudomonas sp. S5F11]MBX4139612.1 hypothetical protein [Pseudomonas sp. S5F11]
MPPSYAAPRRLSEQQLKNPLIRSAFERLGNLVQNRGRYLRRLDRVNGDRRTRVEVFMAFQKSAEQILVRYDLATGVLGYLDENSGRYVLNTQRRIAEDSPSPRRSYVDCLKPSTPPATFIGASSVYAWKRRTKTA